MTGARISEVFKSFGKLIKLDEIGQADASGLKSALVANMQQFAAQPGNDYDDLTTVVVPLTTRMQAAAGALDRVPAYVKASAEIYVRVIGSEMGQPAAASAATILNALKAQMAVAGQTIAPSGKFWNYFSTNFGFTTFPTSGTPNIPDAWITTSIV
jgi:hypothetical protein